MTAALEFTEGGPPGRGAGTGSLWKSTAPPAAPSEKNLWNPVETGDASFPGATVLSSGNVCLGRPAGPHVVTSHSISTLDLRQDG